MLRMVVVLAWVAVVSGCSPFTKLALDGLPTAKDFPEAKYVVLLDEAVVRYVPEGPGGAPQAITTRRWRVKVLKPTILPPLTAHYDSAFSRVESMAGRIVKADGTEEPIDDSKKFDRPVFSGGILFDDERVITIPVPPVPLGAVFESEIVTRRLDVKPSVFREWFGDEMPVKVARFVVTAPADWTLRWQVQSWDGQPFAPKEETVGSIKRLVFERTDLAPLEKEGKSPEYYALQPSAAVRLEEWTEGGAKKSAFPTPEALSAWLAGEYAKQAVASPELERTVKEVLATVPDEPEAKARALYEHACRSIQYCAIEIGYGGWIPHDSASVLKNRYGDCKDKATYLHTLLRVAGISSAPTLIYSHRGSPMPFLFPSLGANFNHAILAVDLPGKTVYADPTWRVVPFGQLPPHDQEAPVLELRPGGAPLKKTYASEAAQNVERQTLELSVDPSGHGAGTVTLATQGASALEMKDRLLTGTGKLNGWLAKQLWSRRTHVEHAKPLRAGDFIDEAAVEGTVEVRDLLSRGRQGDALLRASDVFDSWLEQWPEDRKTNVVSQNAETLEAKLVLRLPAGSEVRTLPADVELDSPEATYALSWKANGATLELTRRLVRKARVIPVARIAEHRAFVWKVRSADHAAAVLRLPVLEASR